MAPTRAGVIGTFEIIEAELWGKETLDLVGTACIRFRRDRTGEFQLIAMQATLDYRATARDGKPAVEFSFEGFDEGDRISGRGWATLGRPDELEGRLFFYNGDESSFTAKRVK